MEAKSHKLDIKILRQPNDTTCGPTCLHAVYTYYNEVISLEQIIKEVHAFEGGGTLAVWLACHALKKGYDATIYTYNLQVFDPTWFKKGNENLSELLKKQIAFKKDPKLILATHAYLEFLELGGKIKLEDLTRDLLRRFLYQNTPILAGLNANFLYRSPREYGPNFDFDDIRGEPCGHFVILSGYNPEQKLISVADPLYTNPYSSEQKYDIAIDRVIDSILLGIVTYDANFLIIKPKNSNHKKSNPAFRRGSEIDP